MNKNTLIYKLIIFILILYIIYLHIEILTLPYLEAKIEKIYDGDTILVTSNKNTYSVRFSGIDCFETHFNNRVKYQSKDYNLTAQEVVENGIKAKVILENKLFDTNNIYLIPLGVDKYGRMIAVPYKKSFFIHKTNLSKYMNKTGYCPTYIWNPEKYSNKKTN